MESASGKGKDEDRENVRGLKNLRLQGMAEIQADKSESVGKYPADM